jgi:uncharacterized protein (DUF433 family)
MAGATDKIDLTLYGGRDPRDLPVYSLDRAAGLLLLPKTTLKAWVFGQEWKQRGIPRFFKPLIMPPDPNRHMLSFVNLVEAHVLKSVRRKHFVLMERVREALDDLRRSHNTDHPLADIDLLAGGRELYIEQGQLLNLTMGHQVAMAFLKVYLNRIERQLDTEKAVRLFPFVNVPIRIGKQIIEHDAKIVAIDPYTSFGRPIISGTGIPTKEIADRVWGGDSITDVMEDFGRTQIEVEYALRWEHAQAVHA